MRIGHTSIRNAAVGTSDLSTLSDSELAGLLPTRNAAEAQARRWCAVTGHWYGDWLASTRYRLNTAKTWSGGIRRLLAD